MVGYRQSVHQVLVANDTAPVQQVRRMGVCRLCDPLSDTSRGGLARRLHGPWEKLAQRYWTVVPSRSTTATTHQKTGERVEERSCHCRICRLQTRMTSISHRRNSSNYWPRPKKWSNCKRVIRPSRRHLPPIDSAANSYVVCSTVLPGNGVTRYQVPSQERTNSCTISLLTSSLCSHTHQHPSSPCLPPPRQEP